MELHEYPRPKDDTGIGVHWNAGFPAAIGLGRIEREWLPELKELGVKWVKISRHDGGLEFAKLLLKNDIMPIVRLYRYQPNPGTLRKEDLEAVSNYVSEGIRYFEFNNEPDLGVEWQGGEVPLVGAPQIVARNAILDMEAILERGGYPGIPALRPGGRWDLVGEICQLGRRDLLSEPVWQAVHNYSANHPLDYPYDRGNQEGAPYTEEFYNRLAAEKWDGEAWAGTTLAQVNELRRRDANPGATAFNDPTCWRGYERYDQLIRNQIGRSLPILATENGYVVGERQDLRYPATTPLLHMAQTVEACQIMMGTSARFDHAPDYLFCSAFWLIGNYVLGSMAPAWENAAWYSQRWPGGRLPVVDALKALPKQPRRWRGGAGLAGKVFGVLRGGGGLTLRLERTDGWVATTQADAAGAYEFADLPLARYILTVIEATLNQEVVLTSERPSAMVNFDLTAQELRLASSVIRGTVQGGAGMTVQLARVDRSRPPQSVVVAADGSYAFSELEAGEYALRLAGTSVARAGIVLDGRNAVVIDLVAPGWGWQVTEGENTPGFGIVRCRVTGRTGMPVRLWTAGWEGVTRITGSKPEYGPDVCEFAPLGAGLYSVQPEGVETVAQVKVDGVRVTWLTFSEMAVTPQRESTISGTVRSVRAETADRWRVQLTGPEGEQSTEPGADGAYAFFGLPAGIYRVEVVGTDAVRDGIVLDGANTVTVDLEVTASVGASIVGSVTAADGAPQPGRVVRLLHADDDEIVAEAETDAEGSYRLAGLAEGTYRVQLLAEDATTVADERADLAVAGTDVLRVDFVLPQPPAEAEWSVVVEDGGPGPGFAVTRCQVEGTADLEVRLWTSGWDGIVQKTGSKREYGPDACEFAPLGAGRYFVEPAGLNVRAEVQLQPNRVTWVRFRRRAAPAPTPAPQRSVIAGRVTIAEGSVGSVEGRIVRLSGPGGPQQTRVRQGRYRFANLAAGVYRVAVLAAEPAQDEVVARDDIRLDGRAEVTVNLVVPGLPPSQGQIIGRVSGGVGRTITLHGPGWQRTTTVAADETYRFDELPAGEYTVVLEDTDPPTGTIQRQAGIRLDGTNSVEVNFVVQVVLPEKTLDHYLFVGSNADSTDDFLTALQYVSRFQPVVGRDAAEARKARYVTILGDAGAVSPETEQQLRASGCGVQRIAANYDEALTRLLLEDRPY